MPKRTDLKKILIIGSGPIVIGQACEFDYSGTQACKALREEGYEVVLANSNPATIMTDPELADRTYIVPLQAETVEEVIARERPQALLPTMGGQTALNLALELAESGVLAQYNVELIGAKRKAIKKAEDRELFKDAMLAAGLKLPESGLAYNLKGAEEIAERIGYPVIVRPSSTLGGTGQGVAYNLEELREVVANGLEQSPFKEVLIEQSVLGWKEYELEVMRDKHDNVVIVCSIENFDPMGIHTGDSITVAPAMTLTDREYQYMRDAALRVIREIGVDTGGSNIQFAVNPKTGELVVIEMNPRVSRSSALASKATGFPIAKLAAKLAVGYTLDELRNDITRETPASFEPTLDYVVVKVPRWAFEKFPGVKHELNTSMKSVGEAMAIGRTFKEALQKALRSLERDRFGLGFDGKDADVRFLSDRELLERVVQPTPMRIFLVAEALRRGRTVEELHERTGIDPWFLQNMKELTEEGEALQQLRGRPLKTEDAELVEALKQAKRHGFSDPQLAHLWEVSEAEVRKFRKAAGVEPSLKLVDTCAAEFEAYTPYFYTAYDGEDENRRSERKKIMILGGGPNRIGQGIEFDYCCVHAVMALKEDGFETIMVNSNPETVSTDYDTSDKLYFEPLTFEDVMNLVEKEQPDGVIVQFGGQTPLNLALRLSQAGVPIIGTSPEDIRLAEDREQFKRILDELGLVQPDNDTAYDLEGATAAAERIGYPVVVRPSYVLGGRAMEIVYSANDLRKYMDEAVQAAPGQPILIDKFVEDAIEIDVDAIADGETVVIGGIMEHIEEAGIHSGDSACTLPPYSLAEDQIAVIRECTHKLAKALRVVGLLNVQYAMKNDVLYVLEVNPRASRTIPFVSKAIGVPLAKLAARVMAGKTLKELGFTEERRLSYTAVKCPVFPFNRLPGADLVLGPEMKSTGEVMGLDYDYGAAFAKAYMGSGDRLPTKGKVFVSVKNRDKRAIIFVAKKLADLGFKLVATEGTAHVLKRNAIEVETVGRLKDGKNNVLQLVRQNAIDLIINTPSGKDPRQDQALIRQEAVLHKVPVITTISGAMAAVNAIEALSRRGLSVRALQEYYE